MKIPTLLPFDHSSLIQEAMRFELAGKTAVSKNNLTYLKVDDQMIHQLFPLLPQNDLLQKPDYFGVEGVGAHISLIYPQEQILIEESDLNQVYDFTIKGFCKQGNRI